MAQFMDNRVSPIKIKIWVAEVEEENHTNQAYTLTQSPSHPVRQLPASVTTFRPRKQRGHAHWPVSASWEGPELRFERRHSTSSLLSTTLLAVPTHGVGCWWSSPNRHGGAQEGHVTLLPQCKDTHQTPVPHSHRWPRCYLEHRPGPGRGKAQNPGGRLHRPVGQPEG